jgi:hypothetical protein
MVVAAVAASAASAAAALPRARFPTCDDAADRPAAVFHFIKIDRPKTVGHTSIAVGTPRM